MIAETGSAPDRRKARWVTDTLRSARADGVDAVVWFEFDKETDWRLSESRTAAAAARAVLTGPGWRQGGDLAVDRSGGAVRRKRPSGVGPGSGARSRPRAGGARTDRAETRSRRWPARSRTRRRRRRATGDRHRQRRRAGEGRRRAPRPAGSPAPPRPSVTAVAAVAAAATASEPPTYRAMFEMPEAGDLLRRDHAVESRRGGAVGRPRPTAMAISGSTKAAYVQRTLTKASREADGRRANPSAIALRARSAGERSDQRGDRDHGGRRRQGGQAGLQRAHPEADGSWKYRLSRYMRALMAPATSRIASVAPTSTGLRSRRRSTSGA